VQSRRGRSKRSTTITWKRSWDLKVFGFIDITREIYAQMRKRKSGVIVNVIVRRG